MRLLGEVNGSLHLFGSIFFSLFLSHTFTLVPYQIAVGRACGLQFSQSDFSNFWMEVKAVVDSDSVAGASGGSGSYDTVNYITLVRKLNEPSHSSGNGGASGDANGDATAVGVGGGTSAVVPTPRALNNLGVGNGIGVGIGVGPATATSAGVSGSSGDGGSGTSSLVKTTPNHRAVQQSGLGGGMRADAHHAHTHIAFGPR